MAEMFSIEALKEELVLLPKEDAIVKIKAWARSNTISTEAPMIKKLLDGLDVLS